MERLAPRRRATVFAVATAAVVIAAACVPSIDSRTTKPGSLTDLLLNVRQVTASRAILRYDFYTEQNLRDVFAAGSVRYIQLCDVNVVPDMKDFPEWIPRLGQPGKTYDAFDLRVRRYRTIDKEYGATVIFRLYPEAGPKPDFDDVERLFGRNWTECPWEPPSAHGPIPIPPVRPHGNACIVYNLGPSGQGRQLLLQFAPDATIDVAIAQAGASELPLWRTETCPQ